MFNQILASLLMIILLQAPALAQGANCGDRAVIVDQLETKYGETRQSMGLNQNNSIVEVFASEQTRTWTILLTMPNGMACLVAAGQDWEIVAGEAGGNGKPA